MNRVFSRIMINHSPRYLSKMHILQAFVFITEIYLNRSIGPARIMMIQLPCNYQSVGEYARFDTTLENDIDEQRCKDRYADPKIS